MANLWGLLDSMLVQLGEEPLRQHYFYVSVHRAFGLNCLFHDDIAQKFSKVEIIRLDEC